MTAELFDVEISIDDVPLLYATKVSSKKNKDNSTTLTFNGDVTTGAKNTGGTISIEALYWPKEIQDVIDLENKLEDGFIESIVCTGKSYTANGDEYERTITGTEVTVTSDEDEWSPSDGISMKLEFTVNKLTRESKF